MQIDNRALGEPLQCILYIRSKYWCSKDITTFTFQVAYLWQFWIYEVGRLHSFGKGTSLWCKMAAFFGFLIITGRKKKKKNYYLWTLQVARTCTGHNLSIWHVHGISVPGISCIWNLIYLWKLILVSKPIHHIYLFYYAMHFRNQSYRAKLSFNLCCKHLQILIRILSKCK